MKWKLASIAAVLTLALAVALPLFAQEADEIDIEVDDVVLVGDDWGHGGGPGDGPGMAMMEELALTKDQLKKLDGMRSTHHKEMIPLRAQVQVKQIELNELFESDATLGTINSKIDEISKLRTDIAKKQAAHRIAMRQMLTKEQREIWDSRPKMMGRMGGHGKAMMERGMRMNKMDCDGKGPRGGGKGRGL